jgi:DNA (cytosine-5)-methyltransferase 1
VSDLVLSLFPGIGLLDRAFEEEGFCVVRGPDLLWGGDVHRFSLSGVEPEFDGIIGGPPCQQFSSLNQAARKGLQPLAVNLIPEFERIVCEGWPRWFIMENVEAAPLPAPTGYHVCATVINNRWVGGVQNRRRRFSFGTRDTRIIQPLEIAYEPLMPAEYAPCVTANGTQWEPAQWENSRGGRRRSDRSIKALKNYIEWQGLPADFLADAPFTVEGKVRVIGNGVPLPMGRAIARAVKAALQSSQQEIA